MNTISEHEVFEFIDSLKGKPMVVPDIIFKIEEKFNIQNGAYYVHKWVHINNHTGCQNCHD